MSCLASGDQPNFKVVGIKKSSEGDLELQIDCDAGHVDAVRRAYQRLLDDVDSGNIQELHDALAKSKAGLRRAKSKKRLR